MVPNLLNLARPIAVYAKIINLEKRRICSTVKRRFVENARITNSRAERAFDLEMEEKLTYVDCCPRMDPLVKTER